MGFFGLLLWEWLIFLFFLDNGVRFLGSLALWVLSSPKVAALYSLLVGGLKEGKLLGVLDLGLGFDLG